MLNTQVFPSVALLSKCYILGMKKGEFRAVRTEKNLEQLDAQHSAPAH